MSEISIGQMNVVIGRFMDMEGTDQFLMKNYRYNKSWDLLMPVVEKIETPEFSENKILRSGSNVMIFYQACVINYEPDEESGDTIEGAAIQAKGETKLEAVYKAVYNFIQWYQANKNHE